MKRMPLYTRIIWLLLGVIATTRMASATVTLPAAFDTPIRTIYVIGHAHLDIGFTHPPSDLAERYTRMINAQIDRMESDPDYKWNIESTWQLEQWLEAESTTAEDQERLFELARQGRLGIAGGHSTLHSSKAGFEQVTRLLWNAKRYRDQHGVPIQTVHHNDVPGVSWTYPQILAKSGIRYLIVGQNLFIGGGFTQPYTSYPFYWEGPDGSRVLTWSSRSGYTDAFRRDEPDMGFGLPAFRGNTVDKARLENTLRVLVEDGYPYDAIMTQHSFDNASAFAAAQAIEEWNAQYGNPRFVIATAEDFFEYLEGKYADRIPSHPGNWTTIWDISLPVEPRGEKYIKNAQSELLTVEKMWTLAEVLGLGEYPHEVFDRAWDMTLTIDEHSGAGGCWPRYWNQEQVDRNNEDHWGYAETALAAHRSTEASAAKAFFPAAAIADSDSIIVFNPMSWVRTDLARVAIGPEDLGEDFLLIDAEEMRPVSYQRDASSGEILFVASEVPPMGYKRFLVADKMPSRPLFRRILSRPDTVPESRLTVGANSLENSRFLIAISPEGYISSLYDKKAGRELVDASSNLDFNRSVTAINAEYFAGNYSTVPDAAETRISIGMNGPVAASLVIENADHPFARSEIILYEGLDRVDLINTPDRSQMLFSKLHENSRYYAFTFPFNLSGFDARIDTAAGWLNPEFDSIPGSFQGSHVIQNAVNLAEAEYGVTVATPDVYTHSFTNPQGGLAETDLFPPVEPSVFSTFIRYSDETELRGGDIGYVEVEPGTDPHWNLRYSIIPHLGGFDAARESRTAWNANTPMAAAFVPASADGPLAKPSESFLSVDQPNILIVSLKSAASGEGFIVKLQEVGRTPSTRLRLSSNVLNFRKVIETTPLEDDLDTLFDDAESGRPTRAIDLSMSALEIRTLRIVTGR